MRAARSHMPVREARSHMCERARRTGTASNMCGYVCVYVCVCMVGLGKQVRTGKGIKPNRRRKMEAACVHYPPVTKRSPPPPPPHLYCTRLLYPLKTRQVCIFMCVCERESFPVTCVFECVTYIQDIVHIIFMYVCVCACVHDAHTHTHTHTYFVFTYMYV